ncbi:sensor histidine kinase [Thalassotalea euphylliae]|uniref:histidine kinase n=1 Tax=Thalassotalea euphylliae TaxID=1655234 RepID=A0A3E0TNV2_9GAMM|nr:HAMP domain-containing sensor histidine kinase [Thalassotalea euphylliae]REL26291.1 sensor histidine kinase [Thalassotalea euphylliae]
MNSISTTLFTRLYLSISAAILISTILTLVIIESYDYKQEINDFKEDISYIHKGLMSQIQLGAVSADVTLTVSPYFEDRFSAKVVNIPHTDMGCVQCLVLGQAQRASYYETEQGVRYAAIALNGPNTTLIITEKLEVIMDEEFDLNVEEAAFLLLISLCLVIIATLLYWPVRQLQSDIKALVECFANYGRGNHQLRASDSIPKPLNEIALSFNKMADAIEKNVEERSVFAQAIPHEIRTPLSRIQLASGLIKRSSKEVNTIDLADDIDNYIEDINVFINQMMELMKLTDHGQHFSDDTHQLIELEHFIRSRGEQLNLERKHEMFFEVDNTIKISAYPVHLILLMDNLLKNALAYTANKVGVFATEKDGELFVSVEDDGEGIAVADREKVFIPFNRLDKSRNRKTGGLGLGLAIARASAHKIGGSLRVDESRWGGAKFTFSLKL